MVYLLACQHTGRVGEIGELADTMTCPVCNTRRKLIAVETREYHVKCDDCRFGRWKGQDLDSANHLVASHNVSHTVHVDYSCYPEHKEKLKQVFGRRVKPFIVSEHRLIREPKTVEYAAPVLDYGDEIPF